ncbi:hypothetical protein JKP88DRAFT_172702 [Tribonema minus]|uniref:Glucose/Sorbosone dehydrogenase domain-containing protein n=1 Tax=Tribonema minus TaxID=303371 RepID=A0A835YGZ7_9STRA|nr:hypothetical protein JKP88DRAFT_172702 [Tribonema minus]
MYWRCLAGATALWLCLLPHSADGAETRGFTTGTPPVIPSHMDGLVVEHVWQFDPDNLAECVVQIQWVPGTDQVVTVHKHGIVRLYPSIDASVDDFVQLIDLRIAVDSDSDHGLLSLNFHPNFAGPNGTKTAFLMYSGNPKDVTLLPNNAAISPKRPADWGSQTGDLPGGYEWPEDLCTNLGPDNYNGEICEKVYYMDRVNVNLDAATPVMTPDITLYAGVCGSSSTHGPGSLLEINGDFYFSMGDGSQFAAMGSQFIPAPLNIIDPGFPDVDACYVPGAGLDQGQFRAQRLDFPNGKVMRIPGKLLDSPTPLTFDDMEIVTKGNRQPFRMFYRETDDTLFIGDVGQAST